MNDVRRDIADDAPAGRVSIRPSAGIPIGPDDTDDRIAELEARLARLEGLPGLRARGRSMLGRVVPDEAGQHFRNAGREQLLGVRSIVDFWIRRLDEAEGTGRMGGRETIELD